MGQGDEPEVRPVPAGEPGAESPAGSQASPSSQIIHRRVSIEQALDDAIAFQKKGSFDQAAMIYKAILKADQNNVDARHLLGVLHKQQGRPRMAVWHIEQAIAIQPDMAQAHGNLAAIYLDLGEFEKAVESCDRALDLQPDYAAVHTTRGKALFSLKRHDEALASHDKATGLDPGDAEAHVRRGMTLHAMKRFGEALKSYNEATRLKPAHVKAHHNAAKALHALNRVDEAIARYYYTTDLSRDYASAHFDLANCLLRLGDFERGLPEYEWRWRLSSFPSPRRDFTQPLWLGNEDIAGRTILLHAEQGLGDTIQFCRYAAMVRKTGAHVILEVPRPLHSLLATLEDVDEVITKFQPNPDFDVHCPLLSLPLALGTRLDTIPASIPYIRPSPTAVAAWSSRLGPRTKPRIGLVWSGGTSNDRRATGLAAFRPLLGNGAEFFSLQKEVRETDRPVLDELPMIRHFREALRDFSDTAALISHMDLVISIDTAVAHLAGAMGVPTWILLPETADWRWFRDRDDSPWYPGVKLFRQRTRGNWRPVIDDAARVLAITFLQTEAHTP